jgi:MarR family transcriptional regulator for hemolysin
VSEPSPRDTIGILIARIARQWRRSMDLHLQPFGLTEATWLPLLHLARARAPLRQKDLAASLLLDGSSVVRLLDELEAAGLVERREAPDDRRAKAIFLTPRGRSTVIKVEQSARKVREEALRHLSESQSIAVQDALKLIARALDPGIDGEATS